MSKNAQYRTVAGVQAVATLKSAITQSGRQNRLSRMLEQISWRPETEVAVNGLRNGPIADRFIVRMVDHDEGHCVTSTIVDAKIDDVAIPLQRSSPRIRELGGGHWKIGRDTIDIEQPDGEARLSWL